MKIRQFIFKLFTIWTRPIFFLFFSFILYWLTLFLFENTSVLLVGFSVLAIALLTIIFSVFYQLVKRNYRNSFLSICTICLFGLLFYYFSIYAFLYFQSSPDKYADKLTIPKNIKIYIPSDTTFSIKDQIQFPDFQLDNSVQPGIYSYKIWTRNIEKGYCYLKAFEVTHNDPLSVDRLKERSKIEIYNPKDSIAMFSMGKTQYNVDRDFTIYEGDWDKPYAARFEVWFVPAKGGQERKLVEKIFKIEGWMR
ncbi:MAG: hypothetical protein EAZ97_15970 [Bacteroidetes bacterium]|nr:MAG: hypothetical protein EAZ97_15970 [Bacteroidota bacterium]